MKSTVARLALAGLLLLVMHERPAAQAPPRGSGAQTVAGPIRVIEGDTFELYIDGRRVGVRVAGIVAPAGNTPCGRQAMAAAEALVARGLVLHEDLALPSFDDRLLRIYRVFTGDGRLFAEDLTRLGLAVPDARVGGATDRQSIAAAAAEASARRVGCVWK